MNLAPNELARQSPDGTIFRHNAIRLSAVIGPVVSRDGHEVSVRADLSVRLVERDADLDLFKEQLLANEPAVTLDVVRQRVTPALETSVRTFAQQHDAEAFLAQRQTVIQLLLERANEIGFACGLEFVAPADAALNCPSLEARRAAERIERERSDQLDRATQVVERARALGSTDGLRPDEQATLLQLLVRGAAQQPLLIAAGANVIRLMPASGETTLLPVPPEIGPIRSVMPAGEQRLLVGGQRGAAIVSPASGPPRLYLHGAPTDRGINSLVIDQTNGVLLAAHSELGLLRWRLDSAEPLSSIDPGGPARFLTAIDERIVFAVDHRVMRLDADRVSEALTGEGQVIDLYATADSIWVLRENGIAERLSRADLSVRAAGFRRSSRLHAAAMIRVEGMSAIALAGESGPVDIVSMSGAPLLELHGPHRGLRMLAASGPYIAGISGDRQILLTWDLARPQAPAQAINLVARHGHRAADITCGSL